MDVDVDKSGRQRCVAEIDQRRVAGNFSRGARINLTDHPVFYHQYRVLDLLDRSVEPGRSERSFHGDERYVNRRSSFVEPSRSTSCPTKAYRIRNRKFPTTRDSAEPLRRSRTPAQTCDGECYNPQGIRKFSAKGAGGSNPLSPTIFSLSVPET